MRLRNKGVRASVLSHHSTPGVKDGTVHTHWVDYFDNVVGDDNPRNLFSKYLCDEYLDRMNLLVDIGCGNGSFLHLLNRPETIGVELDMNALRIAKRNCPRSEFVLASSLLLPFKNKSFDHVTLWEVIEHVPKGTESSLIAEVKGVLKTEGLLSLSTPSNHALSVLLDPAYFLKRHRHYNMKTLRHILTKQGFTIKKEQVKGGFNALIEMNLFYIFKHVLRKRPSGRVYAFFHSRSKSEYQVDHGISNCFIIGQKIDQ